MPSALGRSRVASVLVAGSVALYACGARTGLELESAPAGDGGQVGTRPEGRQLSMSWGKACAIVDGGVRCWGDTGLGIVPSVERPGPPTPIVGLENIIEVATGQLLACALSEVGVVSCWGNGAGSPTPVVVDAFDPARRLYVGSAAVCVITRAGALQCTGHPSFFVGGRCLEPTAAVSLEGARTIPLDDVVDVALGQRHGCAALGDGSVHCWGCNREGVTLGIADDIGGSQDPVHVEGVSGAIAIAAETGATCARDRAGAVTCWGEGSQFGRSLTFLPSPPVVVDFGATARDLDVGVISSCAVVDGGMSCRGFLSIGDPCERLVEGRRYEVAGASEVSIGYEDLCLRTASGEVYCMGCNASGAVGDGTTTPRVEPTRVIF